MTLNKLGLLLLTLLVSASIAFANETAKECKADSDCDHGHHCEHGHCK